MAAIDDKIKLNRQTQLRLEDKISRLHIELSQLEEKLTDLREEEWKLIAELKKVFKEE